MFHAPNTSHLAHAISLFSVQMYLEHRAYALREYMLWNHTITCLWLRIIGGTTTRTIGLVVDVLTHVLISSEHPLTPTAHKLLLLWMEHFCQAAAGSVITG